MAQYKVPQDVEADDKLLGPFTFRQFVYLLIAGGLIALAVFFFNIFPVLVIIPVPFILFFLALSLPLKKDQPMETYLVALVSYYLKPRVRKWNPGQRESTIEITAPKIVTNEARVRDISGEEATHRLSFLADIVDSGGSAINNIDKSTMRDDLAAEANNTVDMFDASNFNNIDTAIKKDETTRREEAIKGMREAIKSTEFIVPEAQEAPKVQPHFTVPTPVAPTTPTNPTEGPNYNSPVVVLPETAPKREPAKKSTRIFDMVSKNFDTKPVEKPVEKSPSEKQPKQGIIDLANNSDFSVATIAKEAKRINKKEDGEVFISLH